MNARVFSIRFGASMAAVLIATAANAQTEDGRGGDIAQSSYAGDIVVTANKREQKLNDVGLTVAVVSGDSLKNQQINSLSDLANTIPSLSFTNSANGTPVYTLRGVGFYESSIGAYPTVSVYLDEVPLSFPVTTRHSAFDLERIEVLKGPQGTLFGQNATGGAINYIAAKPTDTLHAGADVSYGRFNEIIGEAYISGPLADGLQGRIAGRIEHADGWQRSNSRPGDKNGKTRNYMGRLLLAAQPTDSIDLLLNINGWKDKSETQAPQLLAFNVQNPFPDPDLATSALSPLTPRASDWTPGMTFANNRMWQTSLRADVMLSDDITMTSLTSYVDYKQRQANEGDGLPIQTLDLPLDVGRIKSFAQELRLSNNQSDELRWVVGANYEKSKVSQTIDLDYTDSSSGNTLGILYGYPISAAHYYTRQNIRNYAFFGNVEYDLTDQFTVKGGVRYTNSRNRGQSCNSDIIGDPIGPFFYEFLLGGAFGEYQLGECFQINDQAETIGGIAPGAPGQFNQTLKEDNVSWRVGVDYKPTPGILLYANVAKGYKAGSFPTVSSSTFASYLPVHQESVLSYEAGFKASLLDRTLQFNGAAFYYDYKDKQLRSKLLALPFGILDILQNIPKSSVKGFELEIVARPTEGFVFNTSFTYLDATIDRFEGINASGVERDFAGTPMPFTPKYQIGMSVDYEFAVTDAVDAFLGSSVNFRSRADSVVGGAFNPPTADPQRPRLFGIGDYTLVDLRAGIKSADDRWRASIWGKNVLNQYYWNNVVAAFDTIGRYTGKPATYGVSVGFRY